MRNSRSVATWVAVWMLGAGICAKVFAASPAQEMSSTAMNFLAALSPEQRTQATYKFQDEERFDWHFIPKARKGLPFKQMDSAQRKLAHALLSSGLSQSGYAKATTIMSLDEILGQMEQGKGPTRDPDLYYFTIFGDPSSQDPWGWRVEGHHLSLNFVVKGGAVLAATPAFFGSNPAEVRSGPRKGLRVLGEEEDMGRKLVKLLSAEQQKTAIILETAPKDVITSNARKVKLLDPPGLLATDLNAEQMDVLKTLVKDYANRHRGELAEMDLQKIEKAGWNKLQFAWAGGVEPGQGHYYRVQGPTFLLEFDNTQNDANHVHSVWRDFMNDFGEDILQEHYREVPHSK